MRPETACGFALFCLLAGGAHANDPAYVDSPANKSKRDPARADGGEQFAYAQNRVAPAQPLETTDDQLGEIRDQLDRLEAAQSATSQEQQGSEDRYRDPPIGGRGLVSDLTRGSYTDPYDNVSMSNRPRNASPGSQIGSGLMQDAAGVVDSRIRNEINGNDGRVYLPAVDMGERPPGY